MNATLINTLLSLIPTAFKVLYEQERMMDLNTVFHQCFDWFVTKYGCTSAKDREANCTAMAADWHPLMGFEVLTSRLFCGVTFASLLGHPTTNKDTVNIGVCVLNRTGLFAEEYKTWILRGNDTNNTIDFAAFKSFWENAVQIEAFATVPVSQHSYGLVATNDNATASLTNAVSNFGTAYTATQESLRSNKTNIMSIQGQLKMLCKAIGNNQPPPGVINYQQRPRGRCSRGQHYGGNNGGGGGHNGGEYNGCGGNQNANGGGGGYNGGKRNATNGSGGYNGGGGTHGGSYNTGDDGTQNPSWQPPTPIKRSTTGTTAAHMVAMWTTTTPAQHAPAQEKITNARQHGPTPWAAQCVACTSPSFPAPLADRLHRRAHHLRPSTTHPPSSSHLATTAHVFP